MIGLWDWLGGGGGMGALYIPCPQIFLCKIRAKFGQNTGGQDPFWGLVKIFRESVYLHL